MAIDYINALNAGSGLNTVEIIDSLVDAERVPREQLINEGKDKKTVEISSLGKIKQQVEVFSSSIGVLDGQTGVLIRNSSSAFGHTVDDRSVISPFNHDIQVSQLAASQTLVFGGFASEDAVVGTGSLSFSKGSWDADSNSFTALAGVDPVAVSIDASANSLAGLRDAINTSQLDATASIIQTAADSYALVIRSNPGASSSFKVTATEDVGNEGLADFAYTTVDPAKQVMAAADAVLLVDGVSVSRQSNQISDLIEGVTLELNATSAAAEKFSAEYDTELAEVAMQNFITSMNALTGELNSLSRRGTNGEDSGPLAGDPFVRTLINTLRSYSTTPIVGYGEDPIYLTTYGVSTERDGSLSLDTEKFKQKFESDPQSFLAFFQDKVSASSGMVDVSVSGNSYEPGVYAFDLQDDGSALLDTASMTRDDTTYRLSSGPASGLRVDLLNGGADSQIYMGRSLLSTLNSFATGVVSSSGSLNSKIQQYNDELLDYEDQLTALDTRMEQVRSRYAEQFGKMEAAVASLKKTGEALDNMMEAWRAGLQN